LSCRKVAEGEVLPRGVTADSVSQVPQTPDARVLSVEDLLINFLRIGEAENLFLRPHFATMLRVAESSMLSTPFGAAALSAAVTLSSM
jgi:hypothetical protein